MAVVTFTRVRTCTVLLYASQCITLDKLHTAYIPALSNGITGLSPSSIHVILVYVKHDIQAYCLPRSL